MSVFLRSHETFSGEVFTRSKQMDLRSGLSCGYKTAKFSEGNLPTLELFSFVTIITNTTFTLTSIHSCQFSLFNKDEKMYLFSHV